jgi:maltose 6'-phosphate phosphatase
MMPSAVCSLGRKPIRPRFRRHLKYGTIEQWIEEKGETMDVRLSYLGILMLALVLIIPGCASKRPPPLSAECGDIATTGQLNILTLNQPFDTPAAERKKSWADIAQYAVTNNVHVFLLQEAVMTDVEHIRALLGTSDSARDLQLVLNERGAEPYELNVMWETGVPLVLTTSNAILSRCHVTRHFSTLLPIESEMVFEGIDLKITRNVQAIHMNVPGYGILHLYNTHLCSACPVEALQRQVNGLFAFIQQVEAMAPGVHTVIGGDFNLDSVKGAAEQAVYETIINSGFRDSYAEYRKAKFSEEPGTLCRTGIPDIHCTDGVSPLQGLIDRQTGAGFSKPTRVDYLFLRGANTVDRSTVVFNPGNTMTGPIIPSEPAVSDHSGVFTKVKLGH